MQYYIFFAFKMLQAFGSGRAILVSRETFHEQLVKSLLRCSMPLTEHHRLQFHPLCYLSLSKYLSLPFIFSSLFPSNRATPLASSVVMVLALDFFLYNPFHDFTQCMSLPVYITPVFCIRTHKHTTAWKRLLHHVADCSSKCFISTSSS